MAVTLQVLELVLLIPLTLVAVAILVAGGRVRERMPYLKLRTGWSSRLIALFFVAVGVYVGWQTITTGISLDAVVILYVVTGVTVVFVVRRSRRSA